MPATSAIAQDRCETINSDPEWTEGLKQLITAIQSNEMHVAKAKAESLATICADAPSLNYLLGKIEEALGNPARALYFFQKSSENTYRFAVEPDTAKVIWYTRYENEHPDRTQAAQSSNKAQIDALRAQNNELEIQNYELIIQNNELEIQNNEIVDEKRKLYGSLMLTGAGIGTGALVLFITGAIITSQSDTVHLIDEENRRPNEPFKYEESSLNAFGWALFGIGTGLLITGSVLTGIFGYKYTHSISTSETVSFHISPMDISLNMQF